MSARRTRPKNARSPMEQACNDYLVAKGYGRKFGELLGSAFAAGADWAAGHLAKRVQQHGRTRR